MNHSSNEVKQLMARASTLVGRAECAGVRGAGADVLRALLPALVNGTKEKNTYVRANAEIALRAVLRLPHDDTFHQVTDTRTHTHTRTRTHTHTHAHAYMRNLNLFRNFVQPNVIIVFFFFIWHKFLNSIFRIR